jgi:DNA polymerase III psi subunit
MSINQRQYDQLTEMGISLWQNKTIAFEHSSSNETSKDQKKQYIEATPDYLTALTKQTLFTDILLSLELSLGEVCPKIDHLDLGLFNWYFNIEEQEQPSIHCQDNNLVSPSILIISQSPRLKKQLWETIMNDLL